MLMQSSSLVSKQAGSSPRMDEKGVSLDTTVEDEYRGHSDCGMLPSNNVGGSLSLGIVSVSSTEKIVPSIDESQAEIEEIDEQSACSSSSTFKDTILQ